MQARRSVTVLVGVFAFWAVADVAAGAAAGGEMSAGAGGDARSTAGGDARATAGGDTRPTAGGNARPTAGGEGRATLEGGRAERKFLVMLAHSPKQYPNPDRDPQGQPPGGLVSRRLVHDQYFDTADPDIDSFAEYWEEVSYGDVPIDGLTTGWVAVPWAIQPPLVDPRDDDIEDGPPVNDPDVPRRSPVNFHDLSDDGRFQYGLGEPFDNEHMSVIRDFDGDPGGRDNGPFVSEPGSMDVGRNAGRPVHKPGERFLDMDGDGRWDGLDEAANFMDHDADGRPDLLGPWIDLNEDGEAPAQEECVYLADADNDRNPDCCPDGAGLAGCAPFPAADACAATEWIGRGDRRVIDCNGNLIGDRIDILIGISRDESPGPDGIPDECQDERGEYLPDRRPMPRCEYEDFNSSGELDVVEPFENFLRRWDPCMFDPDVSPENEGTKRAHWIKVFDPASGGAPSCDDPDGRFDYAAHSRSEDPDLRIPSYIEHNYPGTFEMLEDEATARPVFGQHDPLGKLGDGDCVCAVAVDGTVGGPCVDFDIDGDQQIDPITETNVCRAGVHAEYNPPDAWTNVVSADTQDGTISYSTKMREAPGEEGRAVFVTATPEPGHPDSPLSNPPYVPLEQPWFQQAWEDRYDGFASDGSTAPDWPVGFDPELGPVPNTPKIESWAELDPEEYDPAEDRRLFKANFGGTNGDGSGWIGAGFEDLIFETGPLGSGGFERHFDAAILPEEVHGHDQPGIYYDGFVEHDDLPSSKNHTEGDLRLGEVTSPWNASPWGQDLGDHIAGAFRDPDMIVPAAGPYAVNIHGNNGRDAGNLLLLEYLTWRRDGTAPSYGTIWELRHGTKHPYAGPNVNDPRDPNENIGFRDYNLDGMIDQGEVRVSGSENYLEDSYAGSPDNGVDSIYPFNRDRLVEDVIEIIDETIDFDGFIDENAMARVACPQSTVFGMVPPQFGGPDIVGANGINSGIVLLPTQAHPVGVLGRAPSFTPIHVADIHDPNDLFPKDGSGNPKEHTVSWSLFFHNLVIGMGVPGETPDAFIPSENFQNAFAAHEYMHSWEQFPDLYDYDVYGPPGPEINCPIGGWDIMARGGLVHPNPFFKEARCTEWLDTVDLSWHLTPGVDMALTIPEYEFVRDRSVFFIQNENRHRERQFFWAVGAGFDDRFPGSGMLVMHTDDFRSNPDDRLPPQQQDGNRFAYRIIQADGQQELESGTDCADDGDPWPGSTDNTHFGCFTDPAARWYDRLCTGLEVRDIRAREHGDVDVVMNWIPPSIPSLRIQRPPLGRSRHDDGDPPAELYDIRFQAADVFGGSWIQLFFTTDPENVSIDPDGANYIGMVRKDEPGFVDYSFPWNITGLPDGEYYIFAELVPDEGEDGMERPATTPRTGRLNAGEGTLTFDGLSVAGVRTFGVEGVLNRNEFRSLPQVNFEDAGVEVGDRLVVDGRADRRPLLRTISEVDRAIVRFETPAELTPEVVTDWHISGGARNARLESWRTTVRTDDGTEWEVASSLSGAIEGPPAMTDKPYASPGGEVAFTIRNEPVRFDCGDGDDPCPPPPFEVDDTFTFTTTGVTAISASVRVVDGRILLADVDEDGDTDLEDFTAFWRCLRLSGPNMPPEQEACLELFDFDRDRDVDLADAVVFQEAFTGS